MSKDTQIEKARNSLTEALAQLREARATLGKAKLYECRVWSVASKAETLAGAALFELEDYVTRQSYKNRRGDQTT